jgi:predicted GNAT family N-acyltransferase
MTVMIEQVSWKTQQQILAAIRKHVFVNEQAVPLDLEIDDQDPVAYHWLAYHQGQPVGTVRMLADGHIGRLAVLAEHRQQGIGTMLLDAVLAFAQQQQLFNTYLYSQRQAIGFYQQRGFTVTGGPFMDAGIEHIKMVKPLAEQRLIGIHGGDFAATHFAETLLSMARQADRELYILTDEISPEIFANPELIDAISKLARKSRYTEVRILVADLRRLQQQGNRLIDLAKRLSSSIKIKRTDADTHELTHRLCIADGIALLQQPFGSDSQQSAVANFNNKPSAKAALEHFNQLWQRGIDDPALRTLSL